MAPWHIFAWLQPAADCKAVAPLHAHMPPASLLPACCYPTLMRGASQLKRRRSDTDEACLVTRATYSTCCRTSSTLMLESRYREGKHGG